MLSQRCLLALFAGLLLTLSALAQGASDANSKVLFVCEHGAAKSVMAAAHFNKLAKERGLGIRAMSRGTNPDPAVSPKVIAGLRAEGLTAISRKPQLLSEQDVSDAQRVITLGCKLPHKAEAADWNDFPSPNEDYAAATRVIQRHVEALLDEVSVARGNAAKAK